MSTNVLLDSVAGVFGGVAGIVVGQPLDTLKARLQTDSQHRYRSTLHCATTTLRSEGPLALFRGVTPPSLSVALVNSILFGTYSLVSNVLRRDDAPLSIAGVTLAGSVGGAAECVVVSPLEYAKLRAQLDRRSSGPYRFLVETWRANGLRGIYRGLAIFALRDIPSFGGIILILFVCLCLKTNIDCI
jgi:solute carrier family 25 carnitine/acylcarnitine transporter 20/29